ncbi:hypothetical protein D3C78_907720 [compost metagenome]
MAVEQLGHASELHGLEVEVLQGGIQGRGVVGEVVGDRGDGALQGVQQFLRRRVVGAVVLCLFPVQLAPNAADPLQGLLQRGGCDFAQGLEAELVELRRIHPARALHQVMGLVHQHRHTPLVGAGQAVEQGTAVEVVVVVADHQVAPARHFLGQVVGAELMGQGHVAQRLAIQPTTLRRSLAGCRQAVVEALGEGAGVTMAGVLRVLAGLVAGHQLQHSQGGGGYLPEGIEGELAARCLRREEEDLVQTLARCRLEQGEQGAEGLADAGGCLGHETAAGAGRLVHRFG